MKTTLHVCHRLQKHNYTLCLLFTCALHIEDYTFEQEFCNINTYAAVKGKLQLAHLKVRRGFDAVSMLNLEVYIHQDLQISTHFIF